MKNLLKKHYGFTELLPGQEGVIKSILEGRDTMVVMPTGSGKSLCYQLPALALPGTAIVISPLIALMKDQVDSLRARKIPAGFVNSSLKESEIKERVKEVIEGKIKILYIAPERLKGGFREHLKKMPIDFVAIDEAHCVSSWGHDFRPDYRKIKEYIETLSRRPAISAFTATATPEVREDIIVQLGLRDPQVFIRGFDRPNLKFITQSWLSGSERDREVIRAVKGFGGSGIVYVGRRKKAEDLAGYLADSGILAAPYHAGLNKKERTAIQDSFMNGRLPVIVATIAFGMGVDKSNVRFVIHAGMPATIEAYYQEAGRAGRDGKPAVCLLLHSEKDGDLQEFFIRRNFEEAVSKGKPIEEASRIRALRRYKLEKMEEYATAHGCRRRMILEYFGEINFPRKEEAGCGNCDFCLI